MKKWKEVAHLYIMSKVQVYIFPDNTINSGFLKKYILNNQVALDAQNMGTVVLDQNTYDHILEQNYKPVLKELGDITYDDAFILLQTGDFWRSHRIDITDITPHEIRFRAQYNHEGRWWRKYQPLTNKLTMEQFLFLIENGYDVFRLIEQGEALDQKRFTALEVEMKLTDHYENN